MKRTPYLAIIAILFLATTGCKRDKPITTTTITETQSTPWPKWIFTPWIWEGEGTTASAQQIVADYKSHGIPVGAIIIDSPWETDYNTFDVDSTLYPGMKGMIDYFHSQDVKVFFWITGGIDTNIHPLYDYAAAHHYFMQKDSSSGPGVTKWWKPVKCSLLDLYNPDAVAWWKTQMDKALALGIDGWKCDGSDFLLYNNFSTPFFYSPYLQGPIPSRNDYSAKYYHLFFDYTRQKLGNDRVVTCRPIDNYGYGFLTGSAVAFCAKDMAWACWVGDQDGTFDGMKAALGNMSASSAYGYLSYGSDIGGYRTDANYPGTGRSKELFLRWAQLGTFSPIMENGGGGEHRPWMFDDETNTIYKRFAALRMQMVPYLMKTASAKFAVDSSMANYFNTVDYTYMLGDDLLVVPVLSNGGTVSVKFPAGNNWVYLFDKTKMYTGGQTLNITIPLTEFPVFVRKGTDVLNQLTP